MEQINDFITRRYDRWLEYASFQANQNGFAHLACDLLNEVLIMLLEKDHKFLANLMAKKKNSYTELDFYVLNLIKTNAFSTTSPFRYKEEKQRVDHNVTVDCILRPDYQPSFEELDEKHVINDKVERLALDVCQTDDDLELFVWRYCNGGKLAEMPMANGLTKHKVESRYRKILGQIEQRLNRPEEVENFMIIKSPKEKRVKKVLIPSERKLAIKLPYEAPPSENLSTLDKYQIEAVPKFRSLFFDDNGTGKFRLKRYIAFVNERVDKKDIPCFVAESIALTETFKSPRANVMIKKTLVFDCQTENVL